MAANWIAEMVARSNYFFATLPAKNGVNVIPMHRGGAGLKDDDLWETFNKILKHNM